MEDRLALASRSKQTLETTVIIQNLGRSLSFIPIIGSAKLVTLGPPSHAQSRDPNAFVVQKIGDWRRALTAEELAALPGKVAARRAELEATLARQRDPSLFTESNHRTILQSSRSIEGLIDEVSASKRAEAAMTTWLGRGPKRRMFINRVIERESSIAIHPKAVAAYAQFNKGVIRR